MKISDEEKEGRRKRVWFGLLNDCSSSLPRLSCLFLSSLSQSPQRI